MDRARQYVQQDEHGVWRVSRAQVTLDSVVAGFHEGQSPEMIRQDYPALSLEEVYGAIAHYLAHQAEIDDYLRRQADVWQRERARAEARRSPVVDRLRQVRREAATRER